MTRLWNKFEKTVSKITPWLFKILRHYYNDIIMKPAEHDIKIVDGVTKKRQGEIKPSTLPHLLPLIRKAFDHRDKHPM